MPTFAFAEVDGTLLYIVRWSDFSSFVGYTNHKISNLYTNIKLFHRTRKKRKPGIVCLIAQLASFQFLLSKTDFRDVQLCMQLASQNLVMGKVTLIACTQLRV